jgi:hypothetical protein
MPASIDGPYEFGDSPPSFMFQGWIPARGKIALREIRDLENPQALPAGRPSPGEHVWTAATRLNNGQHIPTFLQLASDCVAAGIHHALRYLAILQTAAKLAENLGMEGTSPLPSLPKPHPPLPSSLCPQHPNPLDLWRHGADVPWVYGVARVIIGKGQLTGPGSYGIWGAQAVRDIGIRWSDDPDMPAYTAARSNDWGAPPGPPADLYDLAHKRKIHRIEKCSSAQHVRDAILNGRMVTIASTRGFKMRPVERDGLHCWDPSGTWNHQMAIIGWIDDPWPAAYRLNSWGPNAHGTPLNDEPPGGAWNLAEDLDREMRTREVEVYAYSDLRVTT